MAASGTRIVGYTGPAVMLVYAGDLKTLREYEASGRYFDPHQVICAAVEAGEFEIMRECYECWMPSSLERSAGTIETKHMEKVAAYNTVLTKHGRAVWKIESLTVLYNMLTRHRELTAANYERCRQQCIKWIAEETTRLLQCDEQLAAR